MEVYTSIYRIKTLSFYENSGYKIGISKGKKELKIRNPVIMREEFFFGENTWAVNEWLYRKVLELHQKWGTKPDKTLSRDHIFEEPIYMEDIESLLSDIKKVLKNQKLAEKIIPLPEDIAFFRPRKETLDVKTGKFITKSNKDFEKTPHEEMYNEQYFAVLKHAKTLLEEIIQDSKDGMLDTYEISVWQHSTF